MDLGLGSVSFDFFSSFGVHPNGFPFSLSPCELGLGFG